MKTSPGFVTRRRRVVLDRAPFLRVEDHEVLLPDGRTIPDWSWVDTPDFVSILAVTRDGLFPFFRQRKYAVRGPTLAPPGGYIEPGEKPGAAARRELREETGFSAPTWIALDRVVVDSNRGAGRAHLYLALEARCITTPDADDLESQELLLLNRREIEAALDAGRFRCLPWTALVALGLRRLDRLGRGT